MKLLNLLALQRKTILSLLTTSVLASSEVLGAVSHVTQVSGTTITFNVAAIPASVGEVCTMYYTLPDSTTGTETMPAMLLATPPFFSFSWASLTKTNQSSGTHTSYMDCPTSGTSPVTTTVVP